MRPVVPNFLSDRCSTGLLLLVAVALVCVSAHFILEGTENLMAEPSYEGKCGDNVTYSFDDTDGTLTISGSGPMYDYNYLVRQSPWDPYKALITTVVIEKGVTTIGNYAFYGCTAVTSATLSDDLESIGNGAFGYCASLNSVDMPDSVTDIGYGAFNSCDSLESVRLSNGITILNQGVFDWCTSLKSIEIPASVTEIKIGAFDSCFSLKSVEIPENVKTIGNRAFHECTSLTAITIPDNVTSVGDYVVYGCTSLTTINIGKSLQEIGGWAFFECPSLTSINVSDDNALYCSVDGVLFSKDMTFVLQFPAGRTDTAYKIPDTVTVVQSNAFLQCVNLVSVTIPDRVTVIGTSAFDYCTSLKSVNIPKFVEYLGERAFFNCPIPSVDLPDTLLSIGPYAFGNCFSLTSVYIPSSVNYIAPMAFTVCTGLTAITVDEGNTVYCSIDGVLFDKDVTTLMQYPSGKSDVSYAIPETVTNLLNYSFAASGNLISVTLPSKLTTIGDRTFLSCDRLFEVINLSQLTDVCNGNYGFENVNNFFTKTSDATVKTDENGFVYGFSGNSYYLIAYFGTATDITIPYQIENSAYIIRDYAFSAAFFDTDGVTELAPTAANLAGSTFHYDNGRWVKQTTDQKNSASSSTTLAVVIACAIVSLVIIGGAVMYCRRKQC